MSKETAKDDIRALLEVVVYLLIFILAGEAALCGVFAYLNFTNTVGG